MSFMYVHTRNGATHLAGGLYCLYVRGLSQVEYSPPIHYMYVCTRYKTLVNRDSREPRVQVKIEEHSELTSKEDVIDSLRPVMNEASVVAEAATP